MLTFRSEQGEGDDHKVLPLKYRLRGNQCMDTTRGDMLGKLTTSKQVVLRMLEMYVRYGLELSHLMIAPCHNASTERVEDDRVQKTISSTQRVSGEQQSYSCM